ncbi:hypothetical protein HOV93_09740 [Planctomycetes bacterium FF15]|uniref:Succinylglutamate desuccinylase/Aspartoacylase catalytic domain-containing protein n=1 Tax=Bremerella alba TaxID=980252 RepID=A0A7V8V2T4_9BACT|nr:hypothetical protein [Bremerella alba]
MTVPTIAIEGECTGPSLLILAGIHGDEYEPIEAVYRLAEALDTAELTGKFVLVPIANRPAFCGRAESVTMTWTWRGPFRGMPREPRRSRLLSS